MALILRELSLALDYDESTCVQKAAQKLGIPVSEIETVRIVRLSLDARRKTEIHYNCTLRVQLKSTGDEPRLLSHADNTVSAELLAQREPIKPGTKELFHRPVIIGAGPCGLFAALLLAREGYKPLIIERGEPVEKRVGDVEHFWTTGKLNEKSNVLFGEGGAGTFSDGKLTTRIKDPRAEDVLRYLVELGAPKEIATYAKPHIGTDKLRKIVAAIRHEVERLGGEYRFQSRLCGFEADGNGLQSVIIENGERLAIPARVCILATGHSARDTYEMLFERGFLLVPKPFAVGVRIEHPQSLINSAQYGALSQEVRLGAAEYQLTAKADERGVYTFCMCPGGEVVASASEEGGVVTNGMSFHARRGENANAALIVQVSPADYGQKPLDGVCFQRQMERAAYKAGGGGFVAPAQRLADFKAGRASTHFGSVKPSYRPGVSGANLHKVLPDFVANGILQALPQFARQLKGFDSADAILTGVETRSSAPLRIERNEQFQAPFMPGVYPCGEGAGYAGGIVSAAVDGLRIAQAVMEQFSPERILKD